MAFLALFGWLAAFAWAGPPIQGETVITPEMVRGFLSAQTEAKAFYDKVCAGMTGRELRECAEHALGMRIKELDEAKFTELVAARKGVYSLRDRDKAADFIRESNSRANRPLDCRQAKDCSKRCLCQYDRDVTPCRDGEIVCVNRAIKSWQDCTGLCWAPR